MTYYFGECAEGRNFDVLVDATGVAVEMLTENNYQRVTFASLNKPKFFDDFCKEVFKNQPAEAKILFTEEAQKIISDFVNGNRYKYANMPHTKFHPDVLATVPA